MGVNEQYYRAGKPIRNRLSKFGRDSIALAALEVLNGLEGQDPEYYAQVPPWCVLLLLKWTFLYADRHGARSIKKGEFLDFVQRLKDLEPHAGLPEPDLPALLFMRGVLYQQRTASWRANKSEIARQDLLFGRLPSSHQISKLMSNHLGISLQDSVDLSFIATCAFSVEPKKPALRSSYFDVFRSAYGEGTVRSFLKSVSVDWDRCADTLHARFDCRHRSSEYRERSPFAHFPILRQRDRLIPVYRPLLFEAMSSYVYRSLRSAYSHEFAQEFGKVFEKYVESGLKRSGRSHQDEGELRRLPGQGEVADFLITEDGGNVWVDAKGVELGLIGMVAHDPAVVCQRIEKTVIKGIRQSDATASRLAGSELDGRKHLPNYVIIITYEDLLLGSGDSFVANFAGQSAKLQAVLASGRIAAERIYTMSIREFDAIVQHLVESKVPITEFLDYVTKQDQERRSMCLQIGQHLNKFCEVSAPGHLLQAYDEMSHRIEDAVSA